MTNPLYASLKPGQFVQVYWGVAQQRPVLGIIDTVGVDSVDIIFFPRFGQIIARASGAWHKEDPRVGESTAITAPGQTTVERALFLPIQDFTAHLNLMEELEELKRQIAKLQQTAAKLQKQAEKSQ